MDKDTELLSRLAANHLYLAQFEALRATLVALRGRDPELALEILQTIVAQAGRFQNILWSPSCSSPALFTYLSTLELLQFNNATSLTWSFDHQTLRLRVEFVLMVQMLIDRVSESTRRTVDLHSFGRGKEEEGSGENEGFETKSESVDSKEGPQDLNGDLANCMRILDYLLELGVRRLKPDVAVDVDGGQVHYGNLVTEREMVSGPISIEEGDLVCLKRVVLEYVDIFYELSGNIQSQVEGWEGTDSAFAITVHKDEKAGAGLSLEEDVKVLGLTRRTIQLAHLDAMKDLLTEGDEEGGMRRVRFLHLGYGVEEVEYRYVPLLFLFVSLLFYCGYECHVSS